MVTACIIQARIGSTRFPGKILQPLPNGRSVLGSVVERAKQIVGIDVVVLAIPDTSLDDILIAHANYLKVPYVRGAHRDVLARYYRAATEVKADVIMRITSDCPFIDPAVCADVLEIYKQGLDADGKPLDYVSNVRPRTFPKGYDCEVFSMDLLERAHTEAVRDDHREHVTMWMVDSWYRPNVRIGNLSNDHGDESEVNLCIDVPEDLPRLYAHLRR